MKKPTRTKKTNRKHTDYAIQYWLQLTPIVLLGLMTVSSLYFVAQFIFISPPPADYPFSALDKANSLLSSFAPLLMFGIAYLLNPRRLQLVPRLLESGLIALAGTVFMYVVSFPLGFIYSALPSESGAYQYVNLGSMVVSVLLFTIFLVIMRRTERWA